MASGSMRNLSSSLSVLFEVIAAVIEHRVLEGDTFLTMTKTAKRGKSAHKDNTVSLAPHPRCSIAGKEGSYFELQAEAALNPAYSAPFYLSHEPCISIVEYTERLFFIASKISLEVFVLMMRYLDRRRKEIILILKV